MCRGLYIGLYAVWQSDMYCYAVNYTRIYTPVVLGQGLTLLLVRLGFNPLGGILEFIPS